MLTQVSAADGPVNGWQGLDLSTPIGKDYKPTPLEKVANVFAQQKVRIECSTPQQDSTLKWAWGYVYLFDPTIHISTYLCKAAKNINNPRYGLSVRALAILTFIHESYHLRKSWSARGDEAKVECNAIRHFKVGAQLFGASPQLADELKVYALAHHWRLVAKVWEYYLPSCKVPRP